MLVLTHNWKIDRIILKLFKFKIVSNKEDKWLYYNSNLNQISSIGYDFKNIKTLQIHLFRRKKEFVITYFSIISFIKDIKLLYNR